MRCCIPVCAGLYVGPLRRVVRGLTLLCACVCLHLLPNCRLIVIIFFGWRTSFAVVLRLCVVHAQACVDRLCDVPAFNVYLGMFREAYASADKDAEQKKGLAAFFDVLVKDKISLVTKLEVRGCQQSSPAGDVCLNVCACAGLGGAS